MNRRFTTAVVVGLMQLAAGCGDARPFDNVGPAVALVLYEGLPRSGYEPAVFESERKTKETFDLHGYAFYREPLGLKAEDAGKLKAIMGDATFFHEFGGEKKCGGFHPDYAIEWTVKGKVYQCLVCFGCGEVKMYTPGGENRYDIDKKPLADILRSYRKNRPPERTGPG